ncbi:putative ribosomal-protein-alanine acetyltransferase [Lasiodiplodia theobromae]|uniref:Putative ribosomal-protein-alanine acetyltransferase n=1 Tax=Lasiodiplodia theobromae TaxID=45133 RepID=A0A5N5DF18_9PEZI|nr:putative ribosomal-protein-alanine acetyltransferase [Lasiodiplodia theobromae]
MENSSNDATLPFPPPPLVTLKSCTIRPYHPNDAASMAKHGNNPLIAQWMTNMFPHPYTLDKAHEWIAMNLPKEKEKSKEPAADDNSGPTAVTNDPLAQQPTSTAPTVASLPTPAEPPPVDWPATTNFAICVDDECVGSIGVKPGADVHARSAEVGYWLGEAAWGRGIATEAAAAYVAWVFETVPGVERLAGCVYGGNAASMRVLEKVGFRREGKLRKAVWKKGVWRDLDMFGLLREEWEEERKGR